MRGFIAGALVFYKRYISPLIPPSCRFSPTCSEYMRLAVLKYGVFRGVGLGMVRLVRCNPFLPGGIDLP